MLKLFRKDSLTPQTERIYKVPLCIQDTIPIYRISENGIFELESPTNKDGGKKKIHQFDRMYLFEDINFSTQDEEEKEETGKRFETLLRSMNVSYKVIVSNHYADNGRLREEILQKAVSKEMEPLAKEYHKLIEKRLQEGRGGLLQSKYFIVSCRKPDYESARNYFNTIEFSIQQLFHRLGSCLIPLDATERLRALHSYYRMGDEASFSFDWNEYLHLKRDWRNDIINTSLREHPEYLEMEGGSCACVMFIRKYPNGLTDQFLNELTNMDFPIIYSMDVEPLDNDVAYQMVMKKYMSNERSINREQELKNENGDYSTNINYERRKQQRDTEEMLDRISSFDERLLYVGITIVVKATSMEELEERTEKVRIIGIFSPVHRSRKTGYALRLGKDLAKTYNVLYLNLEMYGGIGGHFPEIGQTVADALYYSRQEKKHLRAALAGMVKHMGPLDYLLPMRMSEDLKAVKIEEWMRFIEQSARQSIYEVLILDIDEGIRGVYELLRMCTEIHVAVIKEEVAQAKMFQFEEELHLMGYDDVRHKMIKKELEG